MDISHVWDGQWQATDTVLEYFVHGVREQGAPYSFTVYLVFYVNLVLLLWHWCFSWLFNSSYCDSCSPVLARTWHIIEVSDSGQWGWEDCRTAEGRGRLGRGVMVLYLLCINRNRVAFIWTRAEHADLRAEHLTHRHAHTCLLSFSLPFSCSHTHTAVFHTLFLLHLTHTCAWARWSLWSLCVI